MIGHVVMFKFRPTASADEREQAVALLHSMKDKIKEIDIWKIGTQYAPSEKRWDVVEVATFPDEAALFKFQAHPAHRELTDFTKEIADWHVVDYEF
ncbi:MAG: Dabb family protein [Patescibacteria group bacterium]